MEKLKHVYFQLDKELHALEEKKKNSELTQYEEMRLDHTFIVTQVLEELITTAEEIWISSKH